MHQSTEDKDALRDTIRQLRADLLDTLQKANSETIIQHIFKSSVFEQAQHIAFYSPIQGEVDPLLLAQLSRKANVNKHFYLPIVQGDSKPLVFAPCLEQSEYINNQFSIPEPVHKKSELIPVDSLDLVLMPLLGFDKQGNRLGMGGGFYDRTFAFKKQKQTKPTLMGIAYDLQEVTSLKAESWDVPLDYIVTENQFKSFNKSL